MWQIASISKLTTVVLFAELRNQVTIVGGVVIFIGSAHLRGTDGVVNRDKT